MHADAAANNTANVNKQIILFMESPIAIFCVLKQEDFWDEWPQFDPSGANDSTVAED
jgi:hypothetical protein